MTTSTTDDEDKASSAADGRTPNTVRVPVRTEGLFGAEVNAEVNVEVAGQCQAGHPSAIIYGRFAMFVPRR